MNTIKELSMNECKKCGLKLHYPSQLHTVFNGHKCCRCLGHEYKDCFNPWQRKKVPYEDYREVEKEWLCKECGEWRENDPKVKNGEKCMTCCYTYKGGE